MTKVADQQPKYIKVMIYLCFRDKSFKSLSHKLKTDGNVQLQTDQGCMPACFMDVYSTLPGVPKSPQTPFGQSVA